MIDENDIDGILKEELTRDFEIEEVVDEASTNTKRKALKVYPKISGLPNIGRTYFVNFNEVKASNQDAQLQMAMKYGSEIYGAQASLGGQRSTGTSSGTGTVSESSYNNGGLISCTVEKFLLIPNNPKLKVKESGDVSGFQLFNNKMGEFIQYVEELAKKNSKLDKGVSKLKENINKFRQQGGPYESQNSKMWEYLTDELLTQDKEWSRLYKNDSGFRTAFSALKNGYESWVEFATQGGNETDAKEISAQSVPNSDWNPNMTYRINIKTNFGEDWFKRKFKSGLLNKALDTWKTAAMAVAPDGSQNKGQKFSADELTDANKRKLDSIQWKMTNKVAKDYITLLLGKKRSKKMYEAPDEPVEKELVDDAAFGKEMAAKALSNRGILGRLKQKIFANQQANNAISVVFQLADPGDGWEIIERESQASNAPDVNADAEVEVSESRNIEVVKVEDDFGLDEISTTLKYVFEGGDIESERYKMVKNACINGTGIDRLVDDCIVSSFAKKV